MDGPITANNPMGVHHAWGRSYKDLFARYYLAELLSMTVKDLEENMSLSEYTGWIAYLEHKHK